MKAFLKLTTALIAVSGISHVAYAQQASVPAEAEATGLSDIIVTAQRKSENLQKAAIAVDVLTSSDLANAGVITAATLNSAAPSLVVVQPGGPNASFFVRGVGNYTNNGFTDPAVAFNVDGVYLGRPTSTTGTFYDLERIEVLKGPQGTLYGRNATGGAVNVIPVKPQIGEFSGYAAAGYGNYNAFDVEGAINAPLGENGAIRISGKRVDRDGSNTDGSNDEKGEGLRFQMLGELSDALSVRIALDYSHQGGIGAGGQYNGFYTNTPGSAPFFSAANLDPRGGFLSPASRAFYAARTIPGAFVRPRPLNQPYQDNSYYGANAEIILKTGAGTLTVIPAYRSAKLNSLFGGPSFDGLIEERDEQFSVEARFQGKAAGPIEWLIGGYFFDESIKGDYTFSQQQVSAFVDFTTGTKSYAAFGRVTANLSDTLRLVGGVRYTHDKKPFVADAPTLILSCTRATPPFCLGGPSVPLADSLADFGSIIPASLLPAGPPRVGPPVPYGANGNILIVAPLAVNRLRTFAKVTYRAAIEYDIAPTSLLYASVETGFRSGGFSASLGHESVEPESITAFTLGSKNRFFDNRAQINIEAFFWKYRDQQVSHFGPDARGNNSFFSENIGRADIKGVDLEAQFLATDTTLLRTNIQYLDSKVKQFTYDLTALPVSPVVGCPFVRTTNTLGQAVDRVNCAGRPGFNAPKWSINAGIEQTFEFGDYAIVFTGDAKYRSNRVIGFEYLPEENSGADTTFDASLRFGPLSEKWSLVGYIRNITNENIRSLTQFNSSVGNVVTSQYAPPRTYGVRASVKF